MLLAQIYQPLPSSSELHLEAVVSVLGLLLCSLPGLHFAPQACEAETRSHDCSAKSLNLLTYSAYRGFLVC